MNYYTISVLKSKIANEQILLRIWGYFEDEAERSSSCDVSQELMHSFAYRPDLGSLSIPHSL